MHAHVNWRVLEGREGSLEAEPSRTIASAAPAEALGAAENGGYDRLQRRRKGGADKLVERLVSPAVAVTVKLSVDVTPGGTVFAGSTRVAPPARVTTAPSPTCQRPRVAQTTRRHSRRCAGIGRHHSGNAHGTGHA